MKCAVVADTILVPKDKDFYSMTLTYELLSKRYLKYYDELYLISRVADKNSIKGDISGYKITNGNNVYANPIEEYSKVSDAIKKRKVIENKIYSVISKCDVVIIRLPNVLGLIAYSLCKKHNVKFLVEMLACPFDSYWNHQNKFGKVLAPIMYYLNKKAIKNAPKVLYVTDEFLQNRYPTNGKSINCSDVVLNGIDSKIIEKRISKIKKYNVEKELRIVTTANVELKIKGHEYVIRALALSRNKNIKYYLIGNGDSTRLKNIAQKYNVSNQVVFVGSLPHNQVFKKMEEMDLYIQPSLQEGMPRALLEAMSIGLPCIGSNVGGIPELLGKEYIFRKKDYKAIASILNNINAAYLEDNSNKCVEKIKKFDIDVLEKKRDSFYKL